VSPRISPAAGRTAQRPRGYVNPVEGTSANAKATVVVPTHGRPVALGRCLEALRDQSIGPALQVIVVYDGRADGPPLAPGVLVVETGARRGPAAARNAGGGQAATSYVLFTDDDCVPAPDWAERLLGALSDGADVVAGRTTSEASAAARASQVITDELMADVSDDGSLRFAPSLNLGCRKDVLADVPFDDHFGEAAGEDRAWCLNVRDRGFVIQPVQAAHVDHHPDLTLTHFVRQHVRYGRGSFRYRSRYGRPPQSPTFYRNLVRRGFRAGPLVGVLVLVAQVATGVGIAGARLSSFRR
jgi:cellulose synthase/poly-beta-1,6-N-acetylglucosamine synthase-like glycosyltransferase